MSSIPTYESVQVGQSLPTLSIPLTTTSIVAGAIATRDWQDVHHDRDLAQAAGLKDIILSMPTTMGLASRYVTEWAGPRAIVKATKLRLGSSAYPGDDLVFNGTISRKEDDGTVAIALEARTASATHASGEVLILLGKEH